MLRRVLARSSLICTAAFLSACTGSPSPSGLERRNATPSPSPTPSSTPSSTPNKATPAAATPSPDKPATTPAATPEPAAAEVAAGQLTVEPPAGTELQPVRLALKDDSVYQITTIGQVAFTGVKPSAFAREERIELDDCKAPTRRASVD
jgi:hypothetical protein